MKKLVLLFLLCLGSMVTFSNENKTIQKSENIVTELDINSYTCTATYTIYLYNQNGDIIQSFSSTSSYTSESQFACAVAANAAEQGAYAQLNAFLAQFAP